MKTQTWLKNEISLIASKEYDDPVKNVILDMEITNGNKTLFVPGFWNGKKEWLIRFALPEEGLWSYKTVCKEDSSLDGITGEVECEKYTGSLDIYKHGFVTTDPDKQYFIYADGTPFFYLGDTHWNFLVEEFDTPGGYDKSHFKYIVDKRVEQGFNVYQSEPIAAKFNIADGIDEKDVEGFKEMDRYFDYIAQRGLVHANAQFFFPTAMVKAMLDTPDYEIRLKEASRYWVARYSCYPCMWTLGQEVDSNFLRFTHEPLPFDRFNNPYTKVCQWLYEFDPLKQPASAHQESCFRVSDQTSAVNSLFRDVLGHTWWAAQWKPYLNKPLDFTAPIDFWMNGQNKPVICYEARYDNYWTNTRGARIQGWTAILNGMFGHGYGAVDIWYYNTNCDMIMDTWRDGVITTLETKRTPWYKAVELSCAYQMGYMKEFFEKFSWWRLEPCFNLTKYFKADNEYYSAAHIDSDLYVAYFYDKVDGIATDISGTFFNLEENAEYTYQWFDPRTNTYLEETPATVTNNSFKLPSRPTREDWVVILKKK